MFKKSLLFSLSIICLGISALIGQVVLIRELTTTFSGNELSLGLALGSWLLGSALGSYFSKKILFKITDKISLLISLQILISFLFYSQIFLARTIKNLLRIPFYELVNPLPFFDYFHFPAFAFKYQSRVNP